ncbi:MAG: hypothetical protein ABI277_04580 [Burkholderiaceae bacterium]
MRPFNWKSATALTLTSMATAVVIQACGHDDGQAVAQVPPSAVAPDPIEGTFQSEVTIKDCVTGATVTSFRGLTAFHQGGTATADNNLAPSSKGIALGTWKRTAVGSYTVGLRFARVLPTGAIGQQRFARAITLAPDGNTLTSTLSAQILDPNDNVIQSICGVETGVRY